MSDQKYTPAEGGVTMFTTTWCGYCRNLKSAMDRENVPYTEVNIEQADDAASIVAEVNGGNQTVPTLLFADGTALTNPSIGEVSKKLGRE